MGDKLTHCLECFAAVRFYEREIPETGNYGICKEQGMVLEKQVTELQYIVGERDNV